jgi:hypothetical protein
MEKRKTHTSAEVTNRYRKKTYTVFRFMVRTDDPLHEQIKGYEENLSDLVRKLLAQHFKSAQK